MAEAKPVIVQGKQLKCAFCGYNQFNEYAVRLNTSAVTFGSGLWSLFAKQGKAYVCTHCGKKEEFYTL